MLTCYKELWSNNHVETTYKQGNIMQKVLWLLFAVIIGVFNAIAIAAALLVIAPTISQAGAIAWTIGGFTSGFFIAQRKR